jgi:hypothetical protein
MDLTNISITHRSEQTVAVSIRKVDISPHWMIIIVLLPLCGCVAP